MEETGTCSTVQPPAFYNCNIALKTSISTETPQDPGKPKRGSWKKIAFVIVLLITISLVAAGFALWPIWAKIKSSKSSSRNVYQTGSDTATKNKPTNGIALGLFSPEASSESTAVRGQRLSLTPLRASIKTNPKNEVDTSKPSTSGLIKKTTPPKTQDNISTTKSTTQGFPTSITTVTRSYSTSITTVTRSCTSAEFHCLNGPCIPFTWLCDGYNDCGNNEDEIAATCVSITTTRSTASTTRTTGCTSSQFRCPANGNCIPLSWLCDGDNDCGTYEDEVNATCVSYCSVSLGFMCQDGTQCIAGRRRCNGVSNCNDGSDERGCGVSTTTTRPSTTTAYCSGFRCSTGGCIPLTWLCDGDNDCYDNEDERDATCGNMIA
jgi:hypothetical protein